jgi:hypothetical protein
MVLDQDYLVDAALRFCNQLSSSCRSLIPAINHLDIFCFIASHSFSRVLHYLSLFIIVFSGRNSEQEVFTFSEHDCHFFKMAEFLFIYLWVNENVSKL